MQVSHFTQVYQTASLKPSDHQPKPAEQSGNIPPPEKRAVDVDISGYGRMALEREMQNIAAARVSQEFVDFRGHDGQLRLGLMALGKAALDDWAEKGLEITEESALAAAAAFQDAFRKNLDDNGPATAGTAIALNRHQIVINSQAVPDWFLEEYESTLSSMSENDYG